MQTLTVKPTDKFLKDYYSVLGQMGQLHIDHEMAVRSAFQNVLTGYSRKLDWTVVPEYPVPGHKNLRIDAALLDFWKQRRGFWEAKDEHDDLEREIKSKLEKGYPRTNTIFQAPERAVLFQNGVRQGLDEDIRDPKKLAELLTHFFAWREADHEEWDSAVAEFKLQIPELAEQAKRLIESEKKSNRAFRERFDDFYRLCQQAINPNLNELAVENMLIQHLLTERIFRRVFRNEEFRSRNVIAAEIEKVVTSMTSKHFSRDQFLSGLDRFYKAIERAADDKDDYSEKQAFLNNVYERFFQGYSPKEADTHGIVYTPQPIVDFMVRSVEDILKKEFGKSLADKGVHILDPFVGTGNFIVRVMRQIAETRKSALPYKYENELHCNEVMLLPYYIASMNIEHEYLEQIGEYKPFDGICLVDTFELAEPEQATLGFMSEENTARVKRQKESPIKVIIGNPPYNAWQVAENDKNKNRTYEHLDLRISETYVRDSSARLRNSLSDPYVKAIRWASDRIGDEGVVAFVSNSSFIESLAFDGMRKHLQQDFSEIFVLDLGGNVRKNPKISGTTHNVFGIQVGVSINLFVRLKQRNSSCKIRYAAVDEFWRKEKKYGFLESTRDRSHLNWHQVSPDNGTWLAQGVEGFEAFVPIGRAENKSEANPEGTVFQSYSNGVCTNGDAYVYDFSVAALTDRTERMVEDFNTQLDRWLRSGRPEDPTKIIVVDERISKWVRNTRRTLLRAKHREFRPELIRTALYRPFCTQFYFFDRAFNEDTYRYASILPTAAAEAENFGICVTGPGSQKPFLTLAANKIADMHLVGAASRTQHFPYFIYDEDGSNRRENITDWALSEFRTHYKAPKITKWDIFHYVYAILHHPEYRERYAANLKRELPRIPFVGVNGIQAVTSPGAPFKPSVGLSGVVPDSNSDPGAPFKPSVGLSGVVETSESSALKDVQVFDAFASAGSKLAELHVNYEHQPEFPLTHIENPNEKLSYRVEKMRLGRDKTSLFYNSFLTLSGIPPEIYEYRLGNRSALEWIIDQYQVSTDKRSGITNDPNRENDPEYILRLIGQVIYVSLETMKIVNALPSLGIVKSEMGAPFKPSVGLSGVVGSGG